MWEDVEKHFAKFPAQAKIARLMLKSGLRVTGNDVFCGDIQLSDSAIGRAANVDRRMVSATLETINKNKSLKEIFTKLRPTCNLKEVSRVMNWGCIEIIPSLAETTGIIAGVSNLISSVNLSIRQVIIEDDPDHSDRPRAFVITESPFPPDIIPKIRDIRGVESVVLH